jgi:CTP:molybdopterin cytidylyltransferase MocA
LHSSARPNLRPPHALVLAAGRGRRFGGDKLLAPYRGRPLLSHVLDVVAEGCSRQVLDSGLVVVAVNDDAAQILGQKAGLTAVLNDAPGLGLSHSLRLGLEALEPLTRNEGGAVLIFLGDQPLVQLGVVERVIAAYRSSGAAVVRPRYQAHPSVPGHPTLLDRSTWHLARNLQGDRGLADLLVSASIETVTIDVPGDNPDVDTQADLHALQETPR